MGGSIGNALNKYTPVGILGKAMTGEDLFGGEKAGYQQQQFKRPDRPNWESRLDPKTGLLQENLTTKWGAPITADQRGIEAYRNMALGTGLSPWAQAQMGQQALSESALKNQTEQQGASAGAEARSALASKAGLSPAAQARLATQQMRAKMGGLQNVGFQGAQARAGIGAQDAANRQQFLANLPGQDIQQAGLSMANRQQDIANQQFNIQNATQEQMAKRAADMNTYNKQMEEYAANKSGEAMKAQGSGGKK